MSVGLGRWGAHWWRRPKGDAEGHKYGVEGAVSDGPDGRWRILEKREVEKLAATFRVESAITTPAGRRLELDAGDLRIVAFISSRPLLRAGAPKAMAVEVSRVGEWGSILRVAASVPWAVVPADVADGWAVTGGGAAVVPGLMVESEPPFYSPGVPIPRALAGITPSRAIPWSFMPRASAISLAMTVGVSEVREVPTSDGCLYVWVRGDGFVAVVPEDEGEVVSEDAFVAAGRGLDLIEVVRAAIRSGDLPDEVLPPSRWRRRASVWSRLRPR